MHVRLAFYSHTAHGPNGACRSRRLGRDLPLNMTSRTTPTRRKEKVKDVRCVFRRVPGEKRAYRNFTGCISLSTVRISREDPKTDSTATGCRLRRGEYLSYGKYLSRTCRHINATTPFSPYNERRENVKHVVLRYSVHVSKYRLRDNFRC